MGIVFRCKRAKGGRGGSFILEVGRTAETSTAFVRRQSNRFIKKLWFDGTNVVSCFTAQHNVDNVTCRMPYIPLGLKSNRHRGLHLTRMSCTRSRASSRRSTAFSRRNVGAACSRSWRGAFPLPPKSSSAASLTAARAEEGGVDGNNGPLRPLPLPLPPLLIPSNSTLPILLLGDGLRVPLRPNLGGILVGLDDAESPREACSCEAWCMHAQRVGRVFGP